MVVLKLINIVLPVFIIIALGYFLGRALKLESKSLSTLTLYVFNPALYFRSIFNTQLDNSQLIKILVFNILLLLIFIIILRIISKAAKYELKKKNALVLASAFPNAGNFGLPIILFAFGEVGLGIGVVFMAVQQILMNSVGVYYASRDQQGARGAFLNIFKIPGFLAVFSAILLKMTKLELLPLLDRPLMLLGNAAIPCLLILLGMSLGRMDMHKSYSFVALAASMKLLVFPLVAFLLLPYFFPIQSIYGKVLLVSAACPTATTITLLALQFDCEPPLVSTVALVTTLTSLVTISLVLGMVL
jgi:predicted permease